MTHLPDLADDGLRVERHAYATADDPDVVVLILVVGGGHTWPGSTARERWLVGVDPRRRRERAHVGVLRAADRAAACVPRAPPLPPPAGKGVRALLKSEANAW